jgi:hypothetical protein
MHRRRTHLRGAQPLVLVLAPVHGDIELVQVLVSQQWVVDQVELTSGMGERVAVAFSWEIHPSEGR